MPDLFDDIKPVRFPLAVRDRLRRVECTPRLLVVTDGLNFSAADGFGLTQFVAALKTSKVHGMTPVVHIAMHGGSTADLQNFSFTGAVINKYDVMFLFASASASKGPPSSSANPSNRLAQAELDAIAAFMQAGKGVFATGDHEQLGAAMCGNLPRVRQMRRWYTADGAPDGSNANRVTTNSPGADGVFEFADQSDDLPQKIYPRYYTTSTGSAPHALLQAPPLVTTQTWQPIEVAPDHPHEGICVAPTALATQPVSIGSLSIDEWPAPSGVQPRPEVIAYGVSYGGELSGKAAVAAPTLFGVIGAYDGHAAKVGRVAVDSTWHHHININIDGTGTSRSGLAPGGVPSPALNLIYAYWQNLANWLMPAKVRMCLLWAQLGELVLRYPLFEELPIIKWPPGPDPGPDPLPDLLPDIGRRVLTEIARALAPDQASEMVANLRAQVLGRPLEQSARWLDEIVVGVVVAWMRADGAHEEAIAHRLGDPHELGKRLSSELRGPIIDSVVRARKDRAAKRCADEEFERALPCE